MKYELKILAKLILLTLESLWAMLWSHLDRYRKGNENDKEKYILRTPSKSLLETLTLRQWLQYWQLRTWINDNLCYLTFNCDTGQHSQFLRRFLSNCIFPRTSCHQGNEKQLREWKGAQIEKSENLQIR